MRDFLRRRIPTVDRILLVESSSRAIVEKLLPVLYRTFGTSLEIDLVTCHGGLPQALAPQASQTDLQEEHDPSVLISRASSGGTSLLAYPSTFPQATRTFRVSDYAGRAGRKRLYSELRRLHYPVLGIICAGDSIMGKWKWALAAHIPAKVFIANENGDFFWLDRSNWNILCQLAFSRSGLAGPGSLRTSARLALFPVTLAFLLLYASAVHLRRGFRLAFRQV